ncbi:MAG TPA: hypothetical protein PK413_05740 [Thermoanaerobaculia bacterium]|nr:hypothetical protein [Thermoanaerobaculia bacterium]
MDENELAKVEALESDLENELQDLDSAAPGDPADRLARAARTSDLVRKLQALAASLQRQDRGFQGSLGLDRLATYLSLGNKELGQLFSASPSTVAAWRKGDRRISDDALARISEADSALNLLLELFRPERLPLVIRRPARVFEGKTALDWILAGRIREVAARYDVALHYQG